MQLDLLPSYNVALPTEHVEPDWKLPIQPDIRSLYNVYADDLDKADKLIAFLYRSNVAAIAIDTEFTFNHAPVPLKNGNTWQDPHAQVPLILSLCAWLPAQNRLVRCAIDLRVPKIARSLAKLFRLSVPFVAHFIQAEMHTLWALGLDPDLPQIWDTWVTARALDLGVRNENGYSLTALCERWNVDHEFQYSKSDFQQSFVNHDVSEDFSTGQLKYAMADAEATLKLYLAQQADVLISGLHAHLHNVEFAYAIANARMVWDGVLIDMNRVAKLRDGLDAAVGYHKSKLAQAGLSNPASPAQVIEFLRCKGFENDLIQGGKPTTEEKVLERLEQSEPLISDILKFRRYSALRGDKMFEGQLVGNDERHHPFHRHFGADTGRNSCTAPNVVGISKTFRPVVIAPKGRALFELDYAQVEVCIAAAVHNDADLIVAANSEDVYSSIAQIFFADELSRDEKELSPSEFKSKRSDLRDKAKVFVLGSLYGMQEKGVAERFGISTKEARTQLDAFFARFPSLSNSMQSSFEDGRLKGFSQIVGGLRRQVLRNTGERNKHINTPIQASAAVTFRRAVVDLYQCFKGTNTKLVLPIHDAVLIECDTGDVERVANEAAFILKAAVRAYFPQLNVKVDVNMSDPSCWNKDGHSDSLDNFLADPSFKL